MNSEHAPRLTRMQIMRTFARIALAACAVCTTIASADCPKVHGNCPPHPKRASAHSYVHSPGVAITHANAAHVTPKLESAPSVGPLPIEHSGKNALNPQPIPPGRLRRPLPPRAAPNASGGP